MEGQFGWGREEGGWRKGPWTAQEDKLLLEYVRQHGEGRWNSVSKLTGLKRSGKSCRLRWVNYLRPDLKRGKITPQEESVILELHALWGNRWSTIARSLPGRTDNEIKNYWRTHFKKGKPSKNIERARARFLKQRREMQGQLLMAQQGHPPPPPQRLQEDEEEAERPEHDNAGGEAAPAWAAAATSPARHEEMQATVHAAGVVVPDDMDDMLFHQFCPMSAFLHGGGGGGSASASASEGSSDGQLDGGAAAWGWGSLWNLDDDVVVVDDVVDDHGGGACCWASPGGFPLLQDPQGLAFY
ncbi:hypothetical protein ACP4OV_006245 [Aristida adscensionis]